MKNIKISLFVLLFLLIGITAAIIFIARKDKLQNDKFHLYKISGQIINGIDIMEQTLAAYGNNLKNHVKTVKAVEAGYDKNIQFHEINIKEKNFSVFINQQRGQILLSSELETFIYQRVKSKGLLVIYIDLRANSLINESTGGKEAGNPTAAYIKYFSRDKYFKLINSFRAENKDFAKIWTENKSDISTIFTDKSEEIHIMGIELKFIELIELIQKYHEIFNSPKNRKDEEAYENRKVDYSDYSACLLKCKRAKIF